MALYTTKLSLKNIRHSFFFLFKNRVRISLTLKIIRNTILILCLTPFRLQNCSSFVTWCIILLEVAIRGWVHGGHKGIDMDRNNAQVGRGI